MPTEHNRIKSCFAPAPDRILDPAGACLNTMLFYNVKMRRRIAWACGCICLNLMAADSHWVRIETPNFEMYTTAGARSARDTLHYFEQVRSFFEQVAQSSGKSDRVRIVAFNSAKEYEPYRPNEFAVAYYHPTGDHDYIVMSHTGEETFPTAIHEYVHLVVRHAGYKFPPWLNEGLAELYSTIKPRGNDILVGTLIAGRYQALLQDKWVPLAAILDAGPDSPYYNEKNKAGSLYNEGWALVHMLALSSEYRAKFPQVMTSISAGTRSDDAIAKAYGKPISAIEMELRAYLHGAKFQGVLIPAKLEKVGDELNAAPADEYQVKLLLAEVGDRPSQEEATRRTYEALIGLYPDRTEPYIDLAYLDWRQKRVDQARQHFAKAFELGDRGPRMLWDYGRMQESTDAAKATQVFRELLAQEPNRLEARMELASLQLRSHAAKDALETLAPVKTVTPQDAPRLLRLLAYANLDAGDRVKARASAEQWKKIASKPEEHDQADQILQFIERSRPGAAAAAPQLERSDGPPMLARRDAPPEAVRPVARRPSLTGKFVEFVCGDDLSVVMETAEGKKLFLIEDPSQLLVNGDSGATRDLACGPQKAVQIRIEYDPAGPNRPGIDGLLRVIHFGQ